jgi:gamma-tubulin complex component 2
VRYLEQRERERYSDAMISGQIDRSIDSGSESTLDNSAMITEKDVMKQRVRPSVNKICEALGIGSFMASDGFTAETAEGARNRYAETSAAVLANMISEFSVTRGVREQSKRCLSERARDLGNAEKYERLYESLRASACVPELDRFNAVVAKIAVDDELKEALKGNLRGKSAMNDDVLMISTKSPPSLRRKVVIIKGDDDVVHKTRVDDKATAEKEGNNNHHRAAPSSVLKALKEMKFLDSDSDREKASAKEKEKGDVDVVEVVDNKEKASERSARNVSVLASTTSTTSTLKPLFPSWNSSGESKRLYLTSDFLGIEYERDVDAIPLASRSTAEQELLLLDDFLHAALGLDGRYVTARRSAKNVQSATYGNRINENKIVKFECESGCEPSLRELLGRMLPMCEDAFACTRFVEKTLYGGGLNDNNIGQTSKALATEIRELVDDWERMITQLERKRNNRDLSLQSAYFYARPAAEALRLLASVSFACENEKGGKLLNILRQMKINSGGDSNSERLLMRLENATAKPYLRRLEKWMLEGDCENDTYEEFFVVQNARLKPESLSDRFENNAYWTQKYVPREPTPWFLDETSKMYALNAGKYVNALREMNTMDYVVSLNKKKQIASFANVPEFVRESHDVSNKLFYDDLIVRGDIRNKLRIVKATFLLAQGDYLAQFFDSPFNSIEELMKPSKFCDEQRLKEALEIAIKNSSAAEFKYHEDITCIVEKSKSNDVELGLEAFSLDFKTNFPANVVLSKSSIAKYQVLFKHLFRAKLMEKKACETWATLRRLHKKLRVFPAEREKLRKMDHYNEHEEDEEEEEEHFLTKDVFTHANAAHWTAQRAISMIQNVLHYLTSEVIEPNWMKMESEIFESGRKASSSSSSADEVIKSHSDFLEATARESMLLRPTLLEHYERVLASLSKLATACEDFDKSNELRSRTTDERKLRVDESSDALDYDDTEERLEDFLELVESIAVEFDRNSRTFLDALRACARTETKFDGLVVRLERPLE